MPPAANNQSIKDFFKPFTIPKNRIPKNDIIEDEIIVASPRPSSASSSSLSSREPTASPTKSRSSRKSSANFSNASTPKKRSPTKKRSGAQHFNGAAEDATIHISSPTATQREMQAVEIPPLMPPPSPQLKQEAATRSATTSFSSTTTLSSVPMSSQSSSRRVVKGGIKAVTNSDSGSADSDSDDLADPSTFVVRKKRKLTPPGEDVEHPIEVPSTLRPARQSTRLSDKKRSSVASAPPLSVSPPRTVYKHSLLNMVKQHERQERTDARIKEAETAFEEAQRIRHEQLKQEEDLGGGLKAAVADDSDEGERMMLAMARTEALQDEEKVYFFRRGNKSCTRSCPVIESEDVRCSWMKVLLKEKTRTQAFLSGFVAEMARQQQPFPEYLCTWVSDRLSHEPREDLCAAYVETLRAYTSRPTPCGTPVLGLSWSYNTLTDDSFEDGLDDPPQGLSYVARVVPCWCERLSFRRDTVDSNSVEFILAGVDENVKRHANLQGLVYDSLEHILNVAPDGERFETNCESILKRFFEWPDLSMQIRCRAVISLPAFSERSHRLRGLLAAHLITSRTDEEQYKADMTDPEWADVILVRLKKAPELKITESTNYALLNSLISILDIAIDAGFSDLAFRSYNPLPARPAAPFGKGSTMSLAESAFNSQIDAITSQLRLMSSRIRDAGTSHLRRTEAKSAIERLVVRLENSVRTRPRPRKGIFGGNTGEQRTFLSSFLKQVETSGEENDSVSVVPVDMLSDRDVSEGSEASAVSGAEASWSEC